MGRGTVYNNITSLDKLEKINPANRELGEDFLEYLSSVNRSPATIKNYRSDLNIFWVYCLEHLNNKFFIELNKREIVKFQNYCLNKWGWGSARIHRVKSCLSSLSNYIENILDDEFEDYRGIIKKIESPSKNTVRQKSIFTEEQIDLLLDTLVATGRYYVACAVALALYSGCRKAELAEFKVSWFDDSNLIVDGAMYKTPVEIRTKGHGKEGKPLYKYTLCDFKKYYDLWIEYRKKNGIESEWLFVRKTENGYEQAKNTTFDSYAVTCSNILNMPFYFHALRHNLCTKLCKCNLPSKIIQEYFGWSNPSLIDVYDDSEASEDFGKYFTTKGIVQAKSGSLNDI